MPTSVTVRAADGSTHTITVPDPGVLPLSATRVAVEGHTTPERAAPVILYHYTDQTGLLGILQSGQLRATNIQYMNDTTEFSLALGLAEERLSARIESSTDPTSTEVLQYTSDSLQGIAHINICAACFCENSDLLSQWRGYGGGAGSFAIGFSSAALERAIIALRGSLGRCIYDQTQQIAIIDALVDYLISSYEADKNAAKLRNLAVTQLNFGRILFLSVLFSRPRALKKSLSGG